MRFEIRNSKFENKSKLQIRVLISNLESRISNLISEQPLIGRWRIQRRVKTPNLSRSRPADGTCTLFSKQRGRTDVGFTLLEVLVALAVLAVGAALTLSLISGSLGNIRKVQLRTRTIEHAQSVLELALLDDSIQQATTLTGDFEDGTRWSVRVEEYDSPSQPQPQTQTITTLPVKLFYYIVEMTSPDSRAPDYRLQTLKLVKMPLTAQPVRLQQ